MRAVMAWPTVVHGINTGALTIALIALAIMIFWPHRFGCYLPAPFAALIGGTLAGLLLFQTAPVVGDVPTGLPALQIPRFDLATLPAIVEPALILALLG